MPDNKYPTFTFKKEPRATGLASVAEPNPATEIKLRGKVVGRIYPPSRWTHEEFWRVSFTVPVDPQHVTPEDPCTWKWIKLKAKFSTEPEARTFVLKHNDVLQRTYDPVSPD